MSKVLYGRRLRDVASGENLVLVLFFVLLLIGAGVFRQDAIAEPEVIWEPTPVVIEPVVVVEPVSPICPGRSSPRWHRPNYVFGQPLRNLGRFLFSPRIY